MAERTRVRPGQWLRASGASLLLMLTATACTGGSASGDAASSTPTGVSAGATSQADPAVFCGAAVDVWKVLNSGPDNIEPPASPDEVAAGFQDYKARLEPPLSAIEHNAPDALKADIATLDRQAEYATQNNNPAAIETDEFLAATQQLRSYVISKCGIKVIPVIATEYQFRGIPANIDAATVAFSLVNQGREPHELDIYRIDDGTQRSVQELVQLPEAERGQLLTNIGTIYTNQDQTDTALVTLTPGRYAGADFTPQGSTADSVGTGPPDAAAGMVGEFSVS